MITADFDLSRQLRAMGLDPGDTVLIHSSYKAIHPVPGGPDGLLDALIAYFQPGLLVFPTHTWQQIGPDYPIFNPMSEPSCVGLLSNLFLKRPGVVRSWHPTHSVAACGRDALDYTGGEEQWDTPCPRQGCWGKLIDRQAKVLFAGCSLKSNTFLHGVEEWNQIPNRIAADCQALKIRTPDGQLIDRPMHRHHAPGLPISDAYDKMEAPFLSCGVAWRGQLGQAICTVCDAAGMDRLTSAFLMRNPDLFADHEPVPEEWYR